MPDDLSHKTPSLMMLPTKYVKPVNPNKKKGADDRKKPPGPGKNAQHNTEIHSRRTKKSPGKGPRTPRGPMKIEVPNWQFSSLSRKQFSEQTPFEKLSEQSELGFNLSFPEMTAEDLFAIVVLVVLVVVVVAIVIIGFFYPPAWALLFAF